MIYKIIIFQFLIIIGFAFVNPINAQSKFHFEKLDELVLFAKTHKKLLDKQYKEADKQQLKIRIRNGKNYNKGKPELAEAGQIEVNSFQLVKDSLGVEYGILGLIEQADKFRFKDSLIYEVNNTAKQWAHSVGKLRMNAENLEGDSLVKYHNAVVRKSNAEVVTTFKSSLESLQKVNFYFNQQETTVNKFLEVCCQTVISEVLIRDQAARKAQYEGFNRWMNQRENSREAGVTMLLGLGLISTLAHVISSTNSTPDQVDYAKRRMRELNEQAKMNCIFRGGFYAAGSDISFGTCSK